MIYLKTSLTLAIFLLASNCTDDENDVPNECPPKIPVETQGNFVLSLSMNKCFEDVTQTIFVESEKSAIDNNLFALGAKFSEEKHSSNSYENVRIKDIEFKRLAGHDLYLNDIYYEYEEGEKIHKIEITLDTLNTNVDDDLKKPIKRIEKDEVIIVYVKYKGESGFFTGPRICENYIGG